MECIQGKSDDASSLSFESRRSVEGDSLRLSNSSSRDDRLKMLSMEKLLWCTGAGSLTIFFCSGFDIKASTENEEESVDDVDAFICADSMLM